MHGMVHKLMVEVTIALINGIYVDDSAIVIKLHHSHVMVNGLFIVSSIASLLESVCLLALYFFIFLSVHVHLWFGIILYL